MTRILFYGGPRHGRVMDVEDIHRPIEVVIMNRNRDISSYLSAADLIFKKVQYMAVQIQVNKSYLSVRRGPTVVDIERAWVMLPVGKTYDYNKIWRMMKRYKALPGYEHSSHTVRLDRP